VLVCADRLDDAAAAQAAAQALYEQKGNVVSARRARDLLVAGGA
jgi:hypothetical protein